MGRLSYLHRVVGSNPASGAYERSPLDQWNPAKVWQGNERQRCAHCWEMIKVGEWSKQNRESGFILHDDCSEDVGAYDPWLATVTQRIRDGRKV
jgi:hypothetical protein